MISDRELIDGCLKGKKESWDLFVERFSKLIWWSIHRALEGSDLPGRAELAREIFQETFARLAGKEQLSGLRDIQGLRKFLVVMACHIALDKAKALSRSQKNTIPSPENFSSSAPAADPGQEAAAQESDGMVREVLGELKPTERACVELHYMDGRTHAQIADILGLGQDTVSSVIRRAKQKLEEKFLKKGLF